MNSPETGQGSASEPKKDTAARKGGGLLQAAREFIYGMAAHDMTRFALKTRSSMEHLFILITMGDMLGVPILPPYYSLRLLPYVVPQISTWKRRMLREKDLMDAIF
ncbi:MAG: hypothetical protein AB1563_08555 [Bacillota bacterium]